MATRKPRSNYWEHHSPDDAIEEHWPYDGPHTIEGILNGGIALERLVRYLNNATQYRDRFDQPWQVHDLLLSVHAALYGLDQLLDQAAGMLGHLGTPESTRAPVAAIGKAREHLGVPLEMFDDKGKFAKPKALVAAVNDAVLAINKVEQRGSS